MGATGSATAGDVILVTGSSTGLGLETAMYLAARGLRVCATVRDLAMRDDVVADAERRGVALDVLQLDITDRRSIDTAVSTIVEAHGSIFGLVNNAGIGLRGCFEDLTEPEIRAVFETNVFGTMAVTRRVLPELRAAGRGRIVTITSVGGRIATFGLSAYCSTKFAQEGFGEALDLEIRPFGLRSILVEPGMIKTSRWEANRGTARNASDPGSPYRQLFARHEELADAWVSASKTQPDAVGRAVYDALTARQPRLRYIVGPPAAAAIGLRRYLPNGLFERVYFGSLLRRITAGWQPPETARRAARSREGEGRATGTGH